MNDRAPYQLPPVMPTRDFNCGSNNRCKIVFFLLLLLSLFFRQLEDLEIPLFFWHIVELR